MYLIIAIICSYEIERDPRFDDLIEEVHNVRIMLTALCGMEGIVPSDLPGFGQPAPSCRFNSPSIQLESYVGMPMSSDTFSDTHSIISIHSSSTYLSLYLLRQSRLTAV
jgi:hypothetical protein